MSKLLNLELMSAATKTKIRAEAGVRTTKKLIDEARAHNALPWRPTKKDERLAFEYFGGIYNERVLIEQDARREIARQRKNLKAREARIIAKRDANKVQFSELYNLRFLNVPKGPFSLTLKSGTVKGVMKTFNFSGPDHFDNWLAPMLVEEADAAGDGGGHAAIVDSAGNTTTAGEKDALQIVSAEIGPASGGRDNSRSLDRVFKTLHYKLDVFDPKSKNNNCGIKVVESILDMQLDAIECRKLLDIEPGVMLSIDNLITLYKHHGGAALTIVDDEFDEDIEGDAILFHNEHYYQIKKAERIIHKGKSTKRGNLFWDIETRYSHKDVIFIGKNKAQLLVPAILSMVYTPYKAKQSKKHTFIGLDCVVQFKNWLAKQSARGQTYSCYAHNGSRFDHYLLFNVFTKQDIEESAIQLRGMSIIGLQYKSHQFKDTCCFLVNSLANLCKGYCITPEEKAYAKIETFNLHGTEVSNTELCFYRPELDAADFLKLEQSDPEFWELYVKYCEYDCFSLKIVWESFEKNTNESIGSIGPWVLGHVKCNSTNTIGSLAKKILNTTNNIGARLTKGSAIRKYEQFLGVTSDCERGDLRKIDFIKNFKNGGISHCNQPGKHNEGVMGVDIKSQYPTALMHMEIPIGESWWVDEEVAENGFYELWNCKFVDSRFKPVPNRVKGKSLDWAAQNIDTMFVDSWMLAYLKKNCGLISYDVHEGLVSAEHMRGSELFKKYVGTFYKIKEDEDALKDAEEKAAELCKEEGRVYVPNTEGPCYNKARREVIKLLLNSVTGKLVEDPSRYFQVKFDDKGAYALNGIALTKDDSQSKIKTNLWVMAGVMVYSYSKRLLFEYINCLPNGPDDVIHVETDGIYFPLPQRDAFKANVAAYSGDYSTVKIGNKLGNVEIEIMKPGTSYWLGKKFYYMKTVHKDTRSHLRSPFNDEFEIDYEKSKIRIKGIPTRTIDAHGKNVDLVNEHFFEEIYAGRSIKTSFSAIAKSLFDSVRNTKVCMNGYTMTRTTTGRINYKEYN